MSCYQIFAVEIYIPRSQYVDFSKRWQMETVKIETFLIKTLPSVRGHNSF